MALFSAAAVSGQSAEKISALLKATQITKGQTAYLAATFQNLINDNASEEEAFKVLAEMNYFSSKESADEPVKLAKVCQVFAKSVSLKGGLLYSITHSSRYAYREFKAKGILPAEVDPSLKVSGRDAIAILDGCSKFSGGNK